MGFQTSKMELQKNIQAKTPLIYVKTEEEQPVIDALTSIVDYNVYSWSRVGGLRLENGELPEEFSSVFDPFKILAIIKSLKADSIFILHDFHVWLKEKEDYVLYVKEVTKLLTKQMEETSIRQHIVITSPIKHIPTELQKLCAVVDFSLPDYMDIEGILATFLSKEPTLALDEETKTQIINASLGLTQLEIVSSFRKSLAAVQTIDPDFLVHEKRHIIQRDGLLKYIQSTVKIDDVGGLKELISWIQKRKVIFDDRLREQYRIANPKGILLTGVPGTGKSYGAKMIANFLNMPLIGLDIGNLMSMWVGESEENLTKALHIVETVSPCVLWIDEFDKAIPNLSNNQSHETTKRMMSTLLTWLQEKKEKVFVIATANNIHHLPPEIMRKGRFDEIFFVDLPDVEERKEILAIHLKKKGLDVANFDLDAIAQSCEGFSGAEIESAINEGCILAAFDQAPVTSEHVMKEIKQTNPLSETMGVEIALIQQWAETFNVRKAN